MTSTLSLSKNSEEGAQETKDVFSGASHPSSAVINEKAILRKIDLHIIPWLALLYLLNFLDRGSIGNAKVRAYFRLFEEV